MTKQDAVPSLLWVDWYLGIISSIYYWLLLGNLLVAPPQVSILRADHDPFVIQPQGRTFHPAFVPISFQCFAGFLVEVGNVPPGPIELATVFPRDGIVVHELLERRLYFVPPENEDLGDCYWVKPAFDPAPDCWEKGGRANDLRVLARGKLLGYQGSAAYKDPVECFGIMGCGKDTGILHVSLEVPELAQADALDINDVCGICDGHFWTRPFERGA